MAFSPSPRPPAWARWADIVTLALVVLGTLVASFGGLRFQIFDQRLSLTSPWRIVVWAVAVAVVRHALVRQPPIHRHLVDALVAGARSPAFGATWPVVLGTRLPILLVGYFAVVTIGYPVPEPPNRISANEAVNLLSRWDAGWYHGIALYGYEWAPDAPPNAQQNIVFFPAFPILMRTFGRLIGSRPMAAGLLISLTAFFLASIYLYHLARRWLPHEEAVGALWLLASYPFALFYSAPYTESLYLCGAVAACVHVHRRECVRASAWGLLVGLTRPNGCLLSIPLGLLAVAHALGHVSGPRASRWRRMLDGAPASDAPSDPAQVNGASGRRALAAGLTAAAMPGVGMLLYSAFVYRVTGHPFTWAAGHEAWGRTYDGYSGFFLEGSRLIAVEGFYEYTSRIPLEFMNALPALFVLALTWFVLARFGLAYALFVLVNLIPPILVGGFLSVGRFTSVLFPVFLALAALVPPARRPMWIAAFAMGQALNASLFFTWRELF